MASRRKKKASPAVGLRALLLVALVLVAAELALPRLTPWGRGPIFVGSARYGHRLLGAQTALGPGDVRERINAQGFRDGPFGPALFARREPGVLRVAVLGGTAAYGRGVEEERLLARRLAIDLARELERREDPRRVDVLNFVCPGYGLQALVRVWADQARTYEPDLVVLCLGGDSARPVVPGVDPGPASLDATIGRSALGDLLLHGILRRERIDPERDLSPLGPALASDPLAPAAQPAWADARERLPKLAQAVREDGSRLIVLALPTEPGGAGAAARWVELCRDANVPRADARETFARDQDARESPLSSDGHGLSEAGHRRAAEALLDAILAEGLL